MTFSILRKLMLDYFRDVFINGTYGFDIALLRAIPIALIAAVDCRISDILIST